MKKNKACNFYPSLGGRCT